MPECGGCASARERCGKRQEKFNPATAVRYGKMDFIGEFTQDADKPLSCGGKVIIQTDRGIEIGEQVPLTCAGCPEAITREKMRAYGRESGPEAYRTNNGRILRGATPDDLVEAHHLEQEIVEKIQLCRKLAEELQLPMQIVDAEHIFGGERIIFYFMSEDRVDFRELVRLLAREFQTRIEMRQVGARDEARLLADYETCGRECCCKNFLKTLKPIGMQMAKLQKATLDPSKVSGRCGRLKCCLRYEHEAYSELNKRLPRTGRRVRTANEEGTVIDRQILTQLLRIRKDDGTVVTIREEDIVERDLPAPPPAPVQGEGNGRGQNGRGGRRSSEGEGDASRERGDRSERRGRERRRGGQPRGDAARGDDATAESAVGEPSITDEASQEEQVELREGVAGFGPQLEEDGAAGEAGNGSSDPEQASADNGGEASQQQKGRGRRRNRNRRRRGRNGGDRPGPSRS